jgi:hypothetical protein
VIPADETLSALVSESPRSNGGGSPVFLLDAWRLAFRYDQPDDDWVDNRYILSDLPSADVLAQRGIKRVMYLVESLDDTEVEEDDLNETFQAWQAAGVAISMMDLDGVTDAMTVDPYPSRWSTLLQHSTLYVSPRRLIIHNPHFFAGSHGGFGGVRATPGAAGGHGHWGGGGFHGGGHGG